MATGTPRRSSVARKAPTQQQVPKKKAQEIVLGHIASGLTREAAMAAVGRTKETYREWMRSDPEFKAEVARLRAIRYEAGDETTRLPIPDFPEFCEELGQPLHWHQLQMWDVIEGREPREPHASFRHAAGTEWVTAGDQHVAGRVIVNLPPGHGKTTTFSINYATWLIHKNPNIKIIVVCKDQGLAQQILGGVKFRLTSPVYRELHARYAPGDGDSRGWKDKDQSWTQTAIWVNGKGDGEKDPTMQALGIGGRIYGARSDVIILDDAVTLANVREYENQSRWLQQEVESRLDGAGLLALLGTRIAPVDLYAYMREMTDIDENPVFTYFSMPAVLEEGDGGTESWKPLWQYETCREGVKDSELRCFECARHAPGSDCGHDDGQKRWMRPKFTPARLRKIRRDEGTWALVYQQQDVAEDSTFNPRAVEASINAQRFPGPMTDIGMGHRPGGMNGLYMIGTVDPASAGCTAMIIGGVDKQTEKRYVLDGFNQRNASYNAIKDAIKRYTVMYGLDEWVIEKNAVQRWLTEDRDLVNFLRAHSCRLTPHWTGTGKLDDDFGVMSMAPLFLTCGEPPSNGGAGRWKKTPETALIELPSASQNAWVAELINQLVVWQPSGMKQRQKTDLVMALWFFHIGANRILGKGRKKVTHLHNPFAAHGRLRDRSTINLAEYRAAAQEMEAA